MFINVQIVRFAIVLFSLQQLMGAQALNDERMRLGAAALKRTLTRAAGDWIVQADGSGKLSLGSVVSSDNTANTVVARDSFGNFSINKITLEGDPDAASGDLITTASVNLAVNAVTAANVGAGTGIWKDTASKTINLKSLVAGSNITITPSPLPDDTTITIASTASGDVTGPGAVTTANQVALFTNTTGSAIKNSTATIVDGAMTLPGTLTVPVGSGSAPSLTFVGQPSSGLSYNLGVNTSIGGFDIFSVQSAGCSITGNLTVSGTTTLGGGTTPTTYTWPTAVPTAGDYLEAHDVVSSPNVTLAWIAPASDARVKQDVISINAQESLERVNKLHPVEFVFIPEKKKALGIHGHAGRHAGLIAQETKEVLPVVVVPNGRMAEDNSPLYKIEYDELTPYLIGSIQALTKRIDGVQKYQKPLKDICGKFDALQNNLDDAIGAVQALCTKKY
jgi:hypothetical protein